MEANTALNESDSAPESESKVKFASCPETEKAKSFSRKSTGFVHAPPASDDDDQNDGSAANSSNDPQNGNINYFVMKILFQNHSSFLQLSRIFSNFVCNIFWFKTF